MNDPHETVPHVDGEKATALAGPPASAPLEPTPSQPMQPPAAESTDAGPHSPTRRRIRVKKQRTRTTTPAKRRRLWIAIGISITLAALLVGAWLLIANAWSEVQTGDDAQKTTRPGALVQAADFRVALKAHSDRTERLLVADAHRAGLWLKRFADEKETHSFVCFDVKAGKQLHQTDLGELSFADLATLSPSGAYLAIKETIKQGSVSEAAITVGSLLENKAVRARWRPFPGGDFLKTIAWMTLLDDRRLLTITTHRQLTWWSLQGDKLQSVSIDDPNNRLDQLLLDTFTKQPRNFALTGDRATLAVAHGNGFDLIDTGTGKTKTKTTSFLTVKDTVLGVALNRNATEIGVYLETPGATDAEESICVYDLKTNRLEGVYPVRLYNERRDRVTGWRGNALSWWSNTHLLLWGGNNMALVLDAASGKPVRQLEGPRNGAIGFGDPDDWLWHEDNPADEDHAYLCMQGLPRDVDPKLDDNKYYPRWWLTKNGVESFFERGDPRLENYPRARPAK